MEAIKPRNARLDIMLSTLRNEPIERMLPKDPIEPIEKAEPREPMDINEFVDHKLSTEFFDPTLMTEFSFSMASNYLMWWPIFSTIRK
ncbi:Uncharacterized protein AUMI_112340 [Aurantimicrobium minutum]|uniref:Uncharacterized protein n=1 Tax=Aurantimicrobium minutum TaxID=708131 RepID=A0A173LXR9_9MICO|nr:Uncharacterized protein AUMI_112340 [Aurantimicrobium minutum]